MATDISLSRFCDIYMNYIRPLFLLLMHYTDINILTTDKCGALSVKYFIDAEYKYIVVSYRNVYMK